MNEQPTSWKVQQINQLRIQARYWRIANTVITFGITVFCLALLYNSAMKLTQPGARRDQFIAEYRAGLTTQVLPQAQQIAQRTWRRLVPAVRTEVVKMQSRYPELADGIERELSCMSVNLPAHAEKTLNETIGEMLAQREQTIQKWYGDIKPEQLERMKTVLQAEGIRRAGNITEVLVKPFEGTVQQIHTDLLAIAASTPGDKTTVQSTAQLTTLLVQLTGDQLNKVAQEPKKLAEVK